METVTANAKEKKVRIIAETINSQENTFLSYRRIRVAAYCRVSTKQEEQINSYEVQKKHYTEKINANPEWQMVGIFADKGITGTSVLKRDEFNKMIKLCKSKKIDMILVKSISRFARNTVDCLHYTRMLKTLGIDVYFEEQGIHSIKSDAEFYISIYGTIAQSESENISANVKWGKLQSAKEGKVAFTYKNFLGYRKGADGNPEIDEEQAETVKIIYDRFLAGDSLKQIAVKLQNEKRLSPSGRNEWSTATIRSILSNEKYKGDAIINKTFTVDCLTKEIRKNNGERPKYYVENNHPAIIDAETFGRVQEELARRIGKKKVKEIGTKTEQGKYSSKYALTELLICGECHTPYRRCTWTAHGEKRIVWRCVKRLDYGKKYCHSSPTLDETRIQAAIVNVIQKFAQQDPQLLKPLKSHIERGINDAVREDDSLDIQLRLAAVEKEINELFNTISVDTIESFDEEKAEELLAEKNKLQAESDRLAELNRKDKNKQSRIAEIMELLDGIKNRTMEYDDRLVRQIIEAIIVESKEKIKVIFIGGYEINEEFK